VGAALSSITAAFLLFWMVLEAKVGLDLMLRFGNMLCLNKSTVRYAASNSFYTAAYELDKA
jgi:hypothetical protein